MDDSRFHKGLTFNESIPFRDSATARASRRLTHRGVYNNTPTYHYNTAFSADSRYLVFTTYRLGRSAIMRAELESGELTVLATRPGFGTASGGNAIEPWGGGGGFSGIQVALAPATGWIVAVERNQLVAVHLETMEERVLTERFSNDNMLGVPGVSCDGRKAYVPVAPEHPDIVRGEPQPERSYSQALVDTFGGRPTTIVEVDIESGAQRDVHHEPVGGTSHVIPSPTDPDLILFDIDLPPTFAYYGDHCASPRAHLLRLSSGAKVPLRPRNAHQFQSHTNFNTTGDRVYYHGPAFEGHEQPVRQGGRLGEMFVGVSDLAGDSLWEINLPEYFYGHVCTHTAAEAIVTDSLVSPDLVTALHYEDRGADGLPRIEILARHATDWQAMAGQLTHPHCHMSPDGRWLSYNRAQHGRSDVYVVKLH